MVVVGGGIAGLVVAHELGSRGYDTLVLEGSPVTGGKLRRHEVAGVAVDVGAEAMLARRPEGTDLAASLGLTVVHPTPATSRIWTRGALRPLPRSLMGVPLDLGELRASGVLSAEGLERVRRERSLSPERIKGDVSVGELVTRRFGEEVTDRLVEPLLGGVYAGHARELSARATVPQLVTLAEQGSVLEQAGELPPSDGPVFAGLAGGMAGLPEALVAAGTFQLRTGATVRALASGPEGFRLVLGAATTTPAAASAAAEELTASAVVLAVPAPPASRLLRQVSPAAAELLAGLTYASTAVVTLAFRAEDVLDGPADSGLDGTSSGFLVPPVDGRRIKASTFSYAKWDWVREAGAEQGLVHLRTSLGRHREETALQASDEDLVAASLADLAAATGLRARPVAGHVQRWGGALPQYAIGHLELVREVRDAVAAVPGLAVCGAAYDGVGVPAVIASARRAVAALETYLVTSD